MGDLDAGDADQLVAQSASGPFEVGQLLRRDDDGQAGGAATSNEIEHVLGAQRGEAADGDHRGLEYCAGRWRP